MNIKLNYSAILCLLSLVIGISCTDLLTEKPASYYATANFFTNPANANMAIIGIYDVMSKLDSYGEKEMYMPCSDDNYTMASPMVNDNDRRNITFYWVVPQNNFLITLWTNKYLGINRANFAISNIQKMPGYLGSDSTILRKYEGEARFLRAVMSYDLVKYWGDVPYKTDPTSTVAQAYTGRVNRDSIYNQIVKDLTIAKLRLPWATSATTPEHATSGAARAMLMRVLLSRAGYSLKIDGNLTRPDDATRTAYFNAIVAEGDTFLLNGYHNLYPSYYGFFKNNSAGIASSSESIYEVAFYSATGSSEDSGFWGTSIGPATDVNSPYGRANSFFRAIPEWDAWYDSTDPRRYTNICKYSINAKGDSVSTSNKALWYPGKWRRQWMLGKAKDPNNTDVNFCLLRYADVLLMYAEALNELGRTTDAITALNLIRARAKIALLKSDFSNYTVIYKAPKVKNLSYIQDADNQGKFRTALYWERGFELCYEGTRKYDLIRWGILYEALINTTTAAFTTDYPPKINFIKGKHELFPIPQREMDVNVSLNHINNPGYN